MIDKLIGLILILGPLVLLSGPVFFSMSLEETIGLLVVLVLLVVALTSIATGLDLWRDDE